MFKIKMGIIKESKYQEHFQKKDQLSTEEVLLMHTQVLKLKNLKTIAIGLKKDKKEDDSNKNEDSVQPEKKENKLMNFIKRRRR